MPRFPLLSFPSHPVGPPGVQNQKDRRRRRRRHGACAASRPRHGIPPMTKPQTTAGMHARRPPCPSTTVSHPPHSFPPLSFPSPCSLHPPPGPPSIPFHVHAHAPYAVLATTCPSSWCLRLSGSSAAITSLTKAMSSGLKPSCAIVSSVREIRYVFLSRTATVAMKA